MKSLVLVLGFVLVATDAYATTRYNSTGMSCAKVQRMIVREGAAIMRWRSKRNNLPLYGRYVRDENFCATSMLPQWVSIPSADNPNCQVKECKYYDLGDDDIFLFGH